MIKEVRLKNGQVMPRLGQGTWFMGEQEAIKLSEKEALKTGIQLGMGLIDTAEMYGEGLSESLIGEVISDIDREQLFLVSKVYPHNASKDRIYKALDHTLKRLNTSYLDLYLLHWRGSVPLAETVACMEDLVAKGKIKGWGVSNFDVNDMEALFAVPNGDHCLVNQVLYHLGSRGVEFELLEWLKDHQVKVMAYCPLAQAGQLERGLWGHQAIETIAKKYQATIAQVLLAFVLRHEEIIAIPKAGKLTHVKENAKGLSLVLDEEDLLLLERYFPKPTKKTYLDMV